MFQWKILISRRLIDIYASANPISCSLPEGILYNDAYRKQINELILGFVRMAGHKMLYYTYLSYKNV